MSALWPHQEVAISTLRAALSNGARRPVLALPTGSGKTRIATEIIRGALGKGNHAIFVVPRISLLEQTVRAFEAEGIWNVGVIQGQNFRTNPSAPVQVASAQTLARREIPKAALVIIDECHLQFESTRKWLADPEWWGTSFVGLRVRLESL